MNLQNQIKRTLSKPKTIEYVSRLLEEGDFSSRSELAGFLCDQLRFYDPSGRPQRGGCLKALREEWISQTSTKTDSMPWQDS